jgi:hypothetical protein
MSKRGGGKGGPQAIGKGGRNSKLHALVDKLNYADRG